MDDVIATSTRRDVLILVPKVRGSGYLKTPLGHHVDARMSAIFERISSRIGYDISGDVDGLDGHLWIAGALPESRDAGGNYVEHIFHEICSEFSQFLGTTYRVVSWGDFFEILKQQ